MVANDIGSSSNCKPLAKLFVLAVVLAFHLLNFALEVKQIVGTNCSKVVFFPGCDLLVPRQPTTRQTIFFIVIFPIFERVINNLPDKVYRSLIVFGSLLLCRFRLRMQFKVFYEPIDKFAVEVKGTLNREKPDDNAEDTRNIVRKINCITSDFQEYNARDSIEERDIKSKTSNSLKHADIQ